jgi:cobalt-zinc-cadmium efflux system membrane fusion protein
LAVTGRLAETFVRVGVVVSKGQVLATIESPDGDAAISTNKQAGSALQSAKSALGKASADLERVRSLVAADAAPAKALLNAEFELQLASTSVVQAEANLRQTEERLRLLGLQPGLLGQRIAVLAPISGKISEVLGVPGEFRNNLNDPLFTISDSSSVWVTAHVSEAVISRFSLGDTVLVEMVAYPGETFRARITQIADTVDAATRTVRVRSEVQNPASRLKPEMYGWACHEPQTPQARALGAKALRSFDGKSQL